MLNRFLTIYFLYVFLIFKTDRTNIKVRNKRRKVAPDLISSVRSCHGQKLPCITIIKYCLFSNNQESGLSHFYFDQNNRLKILYERRSIYFNVMLESLSTSYYLFQNNNSNVLPVKNGTIKLYILYLVIKCHK